MAAHLVDHLVAAKGFLKLVKGKPGYVAAKKAQADYAVATLASQTSLETKVGSQLMAAISAMPFKDDLKSTLLERVAALMAAAPAAEAAPGGQRGGKRRAAQDFQSLVSFCTQEDWKIFMDSRMDGAVKIQRLIHRAWALGLRTTHERTFQRMSAMLLMAADGFDQAVLLSARSKYQYLQQLKKAAKKKFKQEKDRGKRTDPGVQTLPHDPALLQVKHQKLYEDVFQLEGPIRCPLDTTKLDALADSIRMRKLAKGLQAMDGDTPVGAVASAVLQAMEGHLGCSLRKPKTGMLAIEDREDEAATEHADAQGASETGRAATSEDAIASAREAIFAKVNRKPTEPKLAASSEDEHESEHKPKKAKPRKKTGKGATGKKDEVATGKKPKKSGPEASGGRKGSPAKKGVVKGAIGNQKGKPSYAVEWSRHQCLCRTGLPGVGQTKAIKFAEVGGSSKAIALAKRWVKEQLKTA